MENYYELPELISEDLIERASKLSSANICDGLSKLGLLAVRCMCGQIKYLCGFIIILFHYVFSIRIF